MLEEVMNRHAPPITDPRRVDRCPSRHRTRARRLSAAQARKILTQHIFGMVDQGELDEQRLTVAGLAHFLGTDCKIYGTVPISVE
jgi:hypothetical protein